MLSREPLAAIKSSVNQSVFDLKYFTEPSGRFVIKIPTEWQYKNIEVGHEQISPFTAFTSTFEK